MAELSTIEEVRDGDELAETRIDEETNELMIRVPEEMEEALDVYSKDPILKSVIKEISDALGEERTEVLWNNLGEEIGIPKEWVEDYE